MESKKIIGENSYKKIVYFSLIISAISNIIGLTLSSGSNWSSGFLYIFLAIAAAPVSPGMIVFVVAALKGIYFGQILTIFIVNLAYHSILFVIFKKLKIKLTLRDVGAIGFGLFFIILLSIYIHGAGNDYGALLTYIIPVVFIIAIAVIKGKMRR